MEVASSVSGQPVKAVMLSFWLLLLPLQLILLVASWLALSVGLCSTRVEPNGIPHSQLMIGNQQSVASCNALWRGYEPNELIRKVPRHNDSRGAPFAKALRVSIQGGRRLQVGPHGCHINSQVIAGTSDDKFHVET